MQWMKMSRELFIYDKCNKINWIKLSIEKQHKIIHSCLPFFFFIFYYLVVFNWKWFSLSTILLLFASCQVIKNRKYFVSSWPNSISSLNDARVYINLMWMKKVFPLNRQTEIINALILWLSKYPRKDWHVLLLWLLFSVRWWVEWKGIWLYVVASVVCQRN